ncbi:MAG: DUF4065 domain-containing protein [Holosporaceae bacterium]|jgi:uncharacterized phage-associated protein|nr:DUF4065 domain-containing protein [Holosporaceae bacterium]
MKTNALSVANYLVECAINENVEIHLLGLIKRVYIVHGFSLAIYDKPAIDSRFDRVEAWKYGPVIPSVYHSFKHYRDNPIVETVEIIEEYNGDKPKFATPELHDEQIKRVCDMVRKRYRNLNDNDIVKLTHMSGTPWGDVL